MSESEKKNDPQSIFSRLFDEFSPHPFYDGGATKIPADILIIDNPAITMSHPLIDFDVPTARTMILKACALPPEPKAKPLIAGLRGIGGGKTRTLVELWKDVNSIKEVLGVAITFNLKWVPTSLESDLYKDNNKRPAVRGLACYAHLIIARMAAVFFARPFNTIMNVLDFQPLIQLALTTPESLLGSFVTYLVSRVKKKVTHFVLFIDETAAGDEFIKTEFQINDATSTVRNALLSEAILTLGTQEELKVGVVMTSLELTPIGQTLSQRVTWPLELPQSLSLEKIKQEWWQTTTSKLPVGVLNIAVAVFANLPRLVQIAAQCLSEAATFESLVSQVCKELYLRYRGLAVPPNHLLYAMVFRQEVKLSSEVMHLLQRSVFINSLTSFDADDEIALQSNLLMLVAAANKPSSRSTCATLLSQMLAFDDLLNQAGDALEVLLYRWLNFRIALIFVTKPHEQVTLETLLQLQEKIIPPIFRESLRGDCFIYETTVKPKMLQASTYLHAVKFVEEISNLLGRSPIQVYRSFTGDAFDVLLLFGKWLFFIDAKSREEDEKADTPSKRAWSKQAEHLTSFISRYGVSWGKNFDGWLYIYFTTHDVPVSWKGNVITVGRTVAEDFFGPLWPVYKAIRAEWNKFSSS